MIKVGKITPLPRDIVDGTNPSMKLSDRVPPTITEETKRQIRRIEEEMYLPTRPYFQNR